MRARIVSSESGLVLCRGHWYKSISADQAGLIRKDIPLYALVSGTADVIYQPLDLDDARGIDDRVCKTTLWKSHLWYIRVDSPEKEEYECET